MDDLVWPSDTTKYPICQKYDVLSKPGEVSVVPDKTIIRARHYRFKPTAKQKSDLDCWFKLSNAAYNMTIDTINNRIDVDIRVGSAIDLKKTVMPEWKKLHDEHKMKMPVDVVVEAIRDARKSYTTSTALIKAKVIKRFRLRHRSDDSPKQCIGLTKQCFGVTHTIYSLSLQLQIEGLTEMKMDSRLIKHNKGYYLAVPMDTPVKNTSNKKPYCGLDPGIRTFLTGYDGDGVFELNSTKVHRKLVQMKKIEESRLVGWKRCIGKIKGKVTKYVDQLHWQSASWLAKTYDTICLGNMSTQNIISKKRNLPKICKREVCLLKPFQFRQRMQCQAEKYSSKVIIVPEYYTSKTCTVCGRTYEIGSSKTYNCSACGHKYDRDANAARNILLRGLTITA